jgi:protein-disulfide isomerase
MPITLVTFDDPSCPSCAKLHDGAFQRIESEWVATDPVMRAAREGTHEQVIAEDESIAREVGVNGVAAGLSTLPLAGVEFLLVALGVTVLSLH